MSRKVEVIPLVNPQTVAREQFASAVQSVAFQLTMSRRMIDCLQVVRDYGFPHLGDRATDTDWQLDKTQAIVVQRPSRNGGTAHNFVGFMRALQHRGLIYFNPTPWNKRKTGQRTVLLSRAGELTCELLMEAGLMSGRSEIRLPSVKGGRA